jgi:ATP-dependent RNA helicase RhlE
MSALISYQIGILQAYKPSSGEMNLEVLVLSSTREAARNRAFVTENMGKDMDMKIPVVIGGENLRETIERVKVKDYSTIFATPDRFLDIFHRGALSLDSLKILILDGLDELIDRGFLDSTTEILSLLPDALDENDGCPFSTQIIAKISKMTTEVQKFIHSYFPSAVHLVAPTIPLRS